MLSNWTSHPVTRVIAGPHLAGASIMTIMGDVSLAGKGKTSWGNSCTQCWTKTSEKQVRGTQAVPLGVHWELILLMIKMHVLCLSYKRQERAEYWITLRYVIHHSLRHMTRGANGQCISHFNCRQISKQCAWLQDKVKIELLKGFPAV